MRDAISLVRKKIEDPSLAFQDATMDAVVTLAAIEVSETQNFSTTSSSNLVQAWERQHRSEPYAYRCCQTNDEF
jgi:hypothetical protein